MKIAPRYALFGSIAICLVVYLAAQSAFGGGVHWTIAAQAYPC